MLSLYGMFGKRIVRWGHPYNINEPGMTGFRRLAQNAKLWLARHCDGFLAYTDDAAHDLQAAGVDPSKITVLNNTIDVTSERECFKKLKSRREEFREAHGLTGRKGLLYVGRLIEGKRIEFLLESFAKLYEGDRSFRLLIVGGGEKENLVREAQSQLGDDAVTAFGPLAGRDRLAPLFIASDLYVLPGYVGLAPLQAFCYDLPAVVFDLDTHSPEIAYLNDFNSIKLPATMGEQAFAGEIPKLLESFTAEKRELDVFSSIAHLTLESMADRFIAGINKAFMDRPR
jgi:glycosyltransferase involved in cell wall biosynthesis